MSVTTRGDREISTRFDRFPSHLHDKLAERIRSLTAELQVRIIAATPKKTGLLQSEIKLSSYEDSETRVAGYVSVYAGDKSSEYAKAATLEYGSDKARKLKDKGSRILALFSRRNRIERRMSKAPHIEAFEYLRRPFEEMQPEIQAALEEVVAETAAEDESS